MQLTLTNQDLQPFLTVLETMTVTQMAANRGRAKLLRHVRSKLDEYITDERDLLRDYVVLDDTGQPLLNETGNFTLRDPKQYSEINALLDELKDEKVRLEFGEYRERYQAFFTYLLEAVDSFTAEQIIVIDDLLDQFESQKGE